MGKEETLWLHISDQEESCIVRQTCRLRNLTKTLPFPYVQRPSLVLFFESPERRYFPADKHAGVHLRLDSDTSGGHHPLLVASTQSILSHWPLWADLGRQCSNGSVIQENVFSRQESLSVLPRVLLPFADAVCFMCVNLSDMRAIEAQVNHWILAWREAGTGTCEPKFVVLLDERYHHQPVAAQRHLRKILPAAKITVVRAASDATWATHGFKPIRERLGRAAVRSRRWKTDHNVLFSGVHLMDLFEKSLDAMARKRRFCFLEASRSLHPVAVDLVKHLNNYIRALSVNYDEDFAAESIASSFLLDQLTPGMHEFGIGDVFTTLYRRSCRGLSESIRFPSPDLILRHVAALYARFRRNGEMVTGLHRTTMQRHRGKWVHIRGTIETCFVCLRRRPEYLLPCSHLLCHSCVKDFGTQCKQNPDRFTVLSCFLCGGSCDLVVLDRPPTAGIGLLCLDGGGVRGIMQTEVLRKLEERIGLPIPVQEHFQLVSGVSAGGLNIISLYLQGWRPATCTRKYEEMSSIIFSKSLLHHVPGLSTAFSLWGPGRYSSDTLQRVIDENYGEERTLLDPSYASSIGSRIILPAAKVPNPSIVLFTNYNGHGADTRADGFEVHEDCRGIAVSDVARSCTAAPTFFQPKYVHGAGWLQDAGLVENNPLSLLLSQYYNMYPAKGNCQYLLNIGSGSGATKARDCPRYGKTGVLSAVVGIYKASPLKRIASAYEWLLGGLSHWQKYSRYFDKTSDLRARCVRLDVRLEGSEPRLDDLRAVPMLKESVRNDPSLSSEIDEMADRVVASMFYFELDEIPTHVDAGFRGAGRILCLRKGDDPSLPLLVEKLVARNIKFVINGKVMTRNLLSPSFWDQRGNFVMPVDFQTVGHELRVLLAWPNGQEFPTSGGPYPIQTLVSAQGLNAYFGLPDHRRWHRAPRKFSDTFQSQEKEDGARNLKRRCSTMDAVTASHKRRKL